MQRSRITHIITVTLALSLVLFLAASIEIHTLAQMSLTVCHCGQSRASRKPVPRDIQHHLTYVIFDSKSSRVNAATIECRICIFITRGDSARDVGLSFHLQTNILRRRLSKDTATNKIREIELRSKPYPAIGQNQSSIANCELVLTTTVLYSSKSTLGTLCFQQMCINIVYQWQGCSHSKSKVTTCSRCPRCRTTRHNLQMRGRCGWCVRYR
jgi:hypothetical protein